MERDLISMHWLDAFKIALVKQDQKALLSLIDDIPQFETLSQMEEAALLIEQAQLMFETEKSNLKSQMQKNRLSKKYLDN